MNKEKIFLLCLTPKERMIWEKKAYIKEEYNELTKKKIFYNRVIEETAKAILEDVETLNEKPVRGPEVLTINKEDFERLKEQFGVK